MNLRWFAALVSAGVVCLTVAAIDLPEKWRSWRYSRALVATGPALQENVGAEATLPWDLFAHCAAGCAELRIIDESGNEVPFLFNVHGSSKAASEARNAHIVENSFVEGKYTQVVGDLGSESSISFDRVTVLTDRPDFLVWAEVALSDDAKTWRIVEPRAPIARFRSRNIEGELAITIRALGSRYLRVRIADPKEKFSVDGLTVSRQVASEVKTTHVPIEFFAFKGDTAAESTYRATLASPNTPNSELRLQTDSPEFYRGVRISGSNDGQEWSYFGSGFVYRYKQGDKTRELLTVEYPDSPSYRLLRAEIINGDDQPLQNVRLTCAAYPRTVEFKYSPEKQYKLLYGNDRASRGQYDLAHYFPATPDKSSFLALSLQPEEITTNYRDPRPFTERHPAVLWLALGAAILLIGLTAIKTLRAPAKPAD